MIVLATWLNIGGLGVDLIGAALLAYDALSGPRARLEASARRTWLAISIDKKEQCEAQLKELSEADNDSQSDAASRLHCALSSLTDAIEGISTEHKPWERSQHRAQPNAVAGIVFLLFGFACQAISSLLVRLAH
jgi:hypothetical protein